MTREEILNMPAGREMDALIAKEVMGWVLNPPNVRGHGWLIHDHKMIGINSLPYFSTDIAAAWEVVEKEEHGFSLWVSGVRSAPLCKAEIIIGDNRYGCYANTAPLAICRAALLAVLEDSS